MLSSVNRFALGINRDLSRCKVIFRSAIGCYCIIVNTDKQIFEFFAGGIVSVVNKNLLGFIFETLNPIYESLLVGVTADTL